MMKTIAAILLETNSPLVIEEISIPENLEPGQVLIEMKCAAICGSQVGEIEGVKGSDSHLPHLLGHEGIAEVLSISKGVTTVAPGDIVVVHWIKGTGIDAKPAIYNSLRYGRVNSGQVAVFSEKSIISENRITRINLPISSSIFSTLGCGLLTSYGVLTRNLNIQGNKGKLLILGFGGIGQLMYLIGSTITNCEFSVLDKNKNSIALATEWGITNSYENLNDIRKNEYEYVIDTTGNAKIIEIGFEALTKAGTMILVGVTPFGHKISIDPMPLHFGRTIYGSFGGNAIPEVDIPKIQNLIDTNVEYFSKYKFKKFKLEQINLAINELRNNPKFSRALIEFSSFF
jgi:S-(hydroxymethyl)glutathione dehydrogenase/alcohol dehydrogenase